MSPELTVPPMKLLEAGMHLVRSGGASYHRVVDER
jgi:hypothetical protein